jgi:hypothetical protein
MAATIPFRRQSSTSDDLLYVAGKPRVVRLSATLADAASLASVAFASGRDRLVELLEQLAPDLAHVRPGATSMACGSCIWPAPESIRYSAASRSIPRSPVSRTFSVAASSHATPSSARVKATSHSG